MADVMTALWGHLTAQPAVIHLVAQRIYPLAIPQDVAMPAVAYQKVSGSRISAHDGPSGWAEARVQFTCTAAEYAEARAIADAIRVSLDGFRGVLHNEVRVDRCGVENEVDGENQVAGYATVRLDVVMLHRE
jgi:hypothetical protein